MKAHVDGPVHQRAFDRANSSNKLTSMFCPEFSAQLIEAEVCWALFVAKHNLAFNVSDHASKLFKMFPDLKVAGQFGCARTKTTAIVKEARAPKFRKDVCMPPIFWTGK